MTSSETEPLAARVPGWRLLLGFLRLGIAAFGGPAMVAYIREVAVSRRGWISDGSFRDGVALCQSIPGATAMQIAAYTGLRAGGVRGAAAAYVGFGLPAFALMVVFSALYHHAQGMPLAVSAFAGLRAIVVALMANATLGFGRSSLANGRDAVLALGAALFLGVGGAPFLAIVLAGVVALPLYKGVVVPAHGPQEIRWTAPAGRSLLVVPAAIALALVGAVGALYFLQYGLFELAAMMTKIDLFAFGGGYASVPLMFHEVVEARHWLDAKTFMDGIALGQVTPGPIVITATFVGYQVFGVAGAIVATIGIFTPSFVILLAVVPYFDRLQRHALFRRAVRGALACFVGLLLAATIRFAFATPWSMASAIIAIAAFTALQFRIEILWVVLAGAAVSALIL